MFAQNYGLYSKGNKQNQYYVKCSDGIACGMHITGLYNGGLAILTHTPRSMGFLNDVFGRPSYERTYFLGVTGYTSEDAKVPVNSKNTLSDIAFFY